MKKYRLELGDGDIEHEDPIIYDIKNRFEHFYIIGKSGMGKSVLMERMAVYDLNYGISIIYIDPKGDSTKRLYHLAEDKSKVRYVDVDHPIGLNPLQKKNYTLDNIISEFVQVLDVLITLTSINPESSVRMKEIMDYALKSFDKKQMTLQYLHDFIKYEHIRKAHKFDDLNNAQWWKEYDKKQGQFYEKRYYHETADSITSRLSMFIKNEYIAPFMKNNEFDVPTLLKNGQSMLVDISQFRKENRVFIANLMIFAIATYCNFSKVNIPLIVYVDEMQVCASELISDVLEFGRGAEVGFVLAHHNFTEIKKSSILGSIFGIVSNFIAFRCGDDEAGKMADIYGLKKKDFSNLEEHTAWVRLGIDNTLVATYPPILNEVPDIDLEPPQPTYNFLKDEFIKPSVIM